MKYVTFETELFFTDIPDEQLDAWFLGGDCAGWFYARLLPVPEIQYHLDPTMEDWGWILAVRAREVVVDVCVWEHLGSRKSWVLGIAAKQRWLRKHSSNAMAVAEEVVVTAINATLVSDPRFSLVKWSTVNPLDAIEPVA